MRSGVIYVLCPGAQLPARVTQQIHFRPQCRLSHPVKMLLWTSSFMQSRLSKLNLEFGFNSQDVGLHKDITGVRTLVHCVHSSTLPPSDTGACCLQILDLIRSSDKIDTGPRSPNSTILWSYSEYAHNNIMLCDTGCDNKILERERELLIFC